MTGDELIGAILNDWRIYLHYTDTTGLAGILSQGVIRPDQKGYVYFTQEPLNPEQASMNLFIGASTHGGRGSCILALRLDDGLPMEQCGYHELRCRQSVRIDQHQYVYAGPNLFR